MMKTTHTPKTRCGLLAIATLALTVWSAAASAQAPAPEQMLEDFVFYTLTANPDLAAANGQALLDSGLSFAEMAVLLDEGGKTTVIRFDSAIIRAQRIPDPELERVAATLSTSIERGRLDLARDPDRIDEAIRMLVGNQRERLIGTRRLIAAGEYAVPSLLRQITEGRDERLKNQCILVLQEIGAQAVSPLCSALPEMGDPVAQRIVCDTLGVIGYPHAAPVLRALAESADTPAPLRGSANRAFGQVASQMQQGLPLSELFSQLGRQYFDENESLIAFPFEETNNVWTYDAFVGLTATPVPTEIFGEVMAMKMASTSIGIDAANEQALSLFVAANLKRENELPKGMIDPIYGELPYTPDFYATVFGTQTSMDVLGMAIDSINTPLVRDAIRALSQTTGGANLFSRNRGRTPLLEALQFPDRRTQYEAALTLARALPESAFPGDFSVVPLLASAVRTGDTTYALVIADDEEDRRVLSNMLELMDFEIVGAEASVASLQNAILESIGIDLVVCKKDDADEAIDAVASLRTIPKAAAVPVLIQSGALDLPLLRPEFRGDRRVLVGRAGMGEGELASQVDAVLDAASGGRMNEAEAQIYAIEALGALRDISVSRSPIYSILDAEPTLLEALEVRTGGTRLLVADILARLDSDRSQRAIFDAALNAVGGEQVDLLDRVAASVKRYGDRAEQRHLDALIDLIDSSGGDTAEAAARVHGSLNLSKTEALGLIPQ
jgi:hypothetical protein